ncbi:MAG: hypothetical protein R3C08_14460 [Hyphomonas sp.]
MRYRISIAFMAFGVTACTPADTRGMIAGGPCSYETSVITATVTEVDENGALFTGDEGEFWVSGEYLGDLPAVGDTLTLKQERITEGTCTPEVYTVVDGGSE